MEELAIAPKVIGGDHPATVAALLAQDGVDAGEPVDGDAVEAMDDAALEKAVDAHTVFGRVLPPQKARIVQALSAAGPSSRWWEAARTTYTRCSPPTWRSRWRPARRPRAPSPASSSSATLSAR